MPLFSWLRGFVHRYTYSEACCGIASITGWAHLLFFLLVYKDTGPFIVMLQQMLANDIKRFIMVYFVFLVGFAQAFFIFGMSGVHSDSEQLRGIAGFLKKVGGENRVKPSY